MYNLIFAKQTDCSLQRFTKKQQISTYLFDFRTSWYLEQDWIENSLVYPTKVAYSFTGFSYNAGIVRETYLSLRKVPFLHGIFIKVIIKVPTWKFGTIFKYAGSTLGKSVKFKSKYNKADYAIIYKYLKRKKFKYSYFARRNRNLVGGALVHTANLNVRAGRTFKQYFKIRRTYRYKRRRHWLIPFWKRPRKLKLRVSKPLVGLIEKQLVNLRRIRTFCSKNTVTYKYFRFNHIFNIFWSGHIV